MANQATTPSSPSTSIDDPSTTVALTTSSPNDTLYAHSFFEEQTLTSRVHGQYRRLVPYLIDPTKSFVLGGAYTNVDIGPMGQATGGGHKSGSKEGNQSSVVVLDHTTATFDLCTASRPFVVPVGASVFETSFASKRCLVVIGGCGHGTECRTILTMSNTKNKTSTFNIIADNTSLRDMDRYFANEACSGVGNMNNGDLLITIGGDQKPEGFEYLTRIFPYNKVRFLKLGASLELGSIDVVLDRPNRGSWFYNKTFFGGSVLPLGGPTNPHSTLVLVGTRLTEYVEDNVGITSIYVLTLRTRSIQDMFSSTNQTITEYVLVEHVLPTEINKGASFVKCKNGSYLIFDIDASHNDSMLVWKLNILQSDNGVVSFVISQEKIECTGSGNNHGQHYVDLACLDSAGRALDEGVVALVSGVRGSTSSHLNHSTLIMCAYDKELIPIPLMSEHEKELVENDKKRQATIAGFKAKVAAEVAAKSSSSSSSNSTTTTTTTTTATTPTIPTPVTYNDLVQEKYERLKVTELKSYLKPKKISTKGKKAELVARCVDYEMNKWQQEMLVITNVQGATEEDKSWEKLKKLMRVMNYQGLLYILHQKLPNETYSGTRDKPTLLKYLLGHLCPRGTTPQVLPPAAATSTAGESLPATSAALVGTTNAINSTAGESLPATSAALVGTTNAINATKKTTKSKQKKQTSVNKKRSGQPSNPTRSSKRARMVDVDQWSVADEKDKKAKWAITGDESKGLYRYWKNSTLLSKYVYMRVLKRNTRTWNKKNAPSSITFSDLDIDAANQMMVWTVEPPAI